MQTALEFYAHLNEEPYPDSLGELICSRLLEAFSLDPYTGESIKLYPISIAETAESGLVYLPHHEEFGDETLALGYWLIVVKRGSSTESQPSSLEPLPGSAQLPSHTVLVLESHPND